MTSDNFHKGVQQVKRKAVIESIVRLYFEDDRMPSAHAVKHDVEAYATLNPKYSWMRVSLDYINAIYRDWVKLGRIEEPGKFTGRPFTTEKGRRWLKKQKINEGNDM
jgi:hypothetical protein